MTGYVDIIKTDIVSNDCDVFWEDVSAVIPHPIANAEVLVIANTYPADSFDEGKLMQMMTGCELIPGAYNFIRLAPGQKIAWHGLREMLQPKAIFLIGVMPAQLGISALFVINEPNSFADCTWLPTIDVAEIEKNEDFKKHLWVNGMKPIFKDKTVGGLS